MNLLLRQFYRMEKYFQAPWSLKETFQILLISAALLIIMLLGLYYLNIDAILSESTSDSLILGASMLVQWTIMLAPLLIWTKFRHKLKWKTLGLNKTNFWTILKEVVLAYILFIGINIIIYWFILSSGWEIPGYQAQEEIVPLFGTDTFSLVVAGIFIVALAPIIEEIFFRGFLLRSFVNKLGVTGGSIVTAAIFSAVHFPWTAFIPIFILALIINSITIKTKSIIPSIAFHTFNNAIAFTVQVLIITEVISVEKLV